MSTIARSEWPSRAAAVPGTDFAAAIGWLLAATIALIGVDEFGIPLGLFGFKAAMVPFGLALILIGADAITTGRVPVPRNIGALLFFIYLLLVCSLFYAGAVDTSGFFTSLYGAQGTFPLTKTFNLFMLATFGFVAGRYVTPRQLLWGAVGLLALQSGKFLYCVWLITHGEWMRVWWLPQGIPRFTLVQGGMTANQMGAMWLVPGMVLLALRAYGYWSSRWMWLVVALAAAGTVSSASRSMMIGLVTAAFGYTYLRGRTAAIAGVTIAAVLAVTAFLLLQPDRVVDQSALGRFGTWSEALGNFENNMILGSGFGSNAAPHSAWLQLLSETGIVGFSLALLALAQHVIGDGRDMRRSLELFVLLFLPYVFPLSVDILILQWQTWVLVIAIAVLQRQQRQSGTGVRIA